MRSTLATALLTTLALTLGGLSVAASADAAEPAPRLVLDATTGSGLSAVGDGVALGSSLIYDYYSPGYGQELWVSDGTAAGTKILKDINPGSKDANVTRRVLYKGKLYFQANDGVHGSELWVSDGTTAGTHMVVDLVPGSTGSGTSDGQLVVAGGTLFFVAYTPANNDQLFATDGTAAGTHVVKYIGSAAEGGNIQNIAAWGNRVVFQADDASGQEPWVSDGTSAGTLILKDLNPGSGNSNPHDFTLLGSKIVFFASKNGTTAGSLWISDIASTTEVAPVGLARDMISLGGTALFTNGVGAAGSELWKTDGTLAGTQLVKDIDPNPGSSSFVDNMALFKGKAYFSANDSANNGELWTSDGTTAGTVKVKEVNPTGGAFPNYFVAAGNQLYFEATTGAAGYELWQTDGTPAGTRLTVDVRPGPEGSSPTPIASVGGALFFAADDGVHSEELWALGQVALAPVAPPAAPPVAAPVAQASSTKAHPAKRYSRKTASAKHIRLTVKVSSHGIVPTGKVTLKKGSRIVGSGWLKKGTVKIRITQKLHRGTSKLRAYYAGSGAARPSHSGTIKIVVK
jgi:ELWxxDGT repeat protein